jgi:apolipoprotein N-acyltransferase
LKKIQIAGISILSGVLLTLAWPVSPLTPLIVIAWLPLLWIADTPLKRNSFLGYSFLCLLVWNTGTTWWMWNSTDIGTIAAILVNTSFMTVPWMGYYFFKKRLGKIAGYFSLVLCWMTFEYIHLNWQLSWPWLTLGNAFASHPDWVLWYAYTGVAGGSLLIIITNLLAYEIFLAIRKKTPPAFWLKKLAVLLCFPISMLLYYLIHAGNTLRTANAKHNVVIVQPNIDPYGKFSAVATSSQIAGLISLSEQYADTATELIVWPETAMSAADWQENISTNPFYQPIFDFLKRHPGITICSGIETFKNYGPTKATISARKTDNGNYFDAMNAAVAIKTKQPLLFYNKSKLVPGVESLPDFLYFMAPVFEKFGGSTGGYGKSTESAVFTVSGNEYKMAPIICYESVYGEYVGSYVQKGANILCIMTNDGWWGNTPGHKQHFQYARLRAIETGRWVARSANTGISAVIDPQGKILETLPWDKAAAIKYAIPVEESLTFYVRNGDYIYRILSVLMILLIIWQVFGILRKKYFTQAQKNV